ncbi:MAG: hypothetical protein ACYC1Q_03315 [Bacteroidia bacterium]
MMKKAIYLFIGLSFLIASCRKEQAFSRFNTNLLLPLMHAELGLDQLLGDSVLIPDPDGSLRLVSAYDLYRGKIADLFVIPDTQRVNTLSLKTLRLADQSKTQIVPLFLIYPDAAALHGQTATIPAQSITGLSPIPVDASGFFKEATLNSGTMEVSITNGYPVEITTLIFQLKNVVDGSVIQTDTFTNILPGANQVKVIDVAGKKLYAQMEATPVLIETAASNGPVQIDQFAFTTIIFSVKDLKPQTAIARFPAQSVINTEETVVYYFGKAQLKKIKVKAGRVSFNIVSTIEEEMEVNYGIPYATRNGQPFAETFTVPAAPPGGSSTFTINYDISGYEIDLRGKDPTIRDTVNSFFNVLDVTIDSTGIERNISLDDSIYMYLGLLDLEPEYAEGYLGGETFVVGPETIDLDFFGGVSGGLGFDNLNFNLVLENGIGAEGRATIHQLTARNTKKGSTVALSGPGINGPHLLAPATYPPLMPSVKVINLNESNSNIKPFIEQLPDKLDYNISIETNPNGNTSNFKDFITDGSEVVAKLEVDMPVSLKADAITLTDTFDFNMTSVQNGVNIVEGNLNIVSDNGFPFEVQLQIYMLDGNGKIIDSLVGPSNMRIIAANADANNRVISPLRSVLIARVDKARMPVFRETRKFLVKAVVDTPKTNANYWKIYSDYTFKVSLTGDFIYDQNF